MRSLVGLIDSHLFVSDQVVRPSAAARVHLINCLMVAAESRRPFVSLVGELHSYTSPSPSRSPLPSLRVVKMGIVEARQAIHLFPFYCSQPDHRFLHLLLLLCPRKLQQLDHLVHGRGKSPKGGIDT